MRRAYGGVDVGGCTERGLPDDLAGAGRVADGGAGRGGQRGDAVADENLGAADGGAGHRTTRRVMEPSRLIRVSRLSPAWIGPTPGERR